MSFPSWWSVGCGTATAALAKGGAGGAVFGCAIKGSAIVGGAIVGSADDGGVIGVAQEQWQENEGKWLKIW